MHRLEETNQFKRDMKLCLKQGKDMAKLKAVTHLLLEGKPLPPRNRDHALVGDWKGHRDCHLAPDWVLIYHVDETKKVITYIRMGSHAEIFG